MHDKTIKFHTTHWAEMSPDVYAGPNCDQQRPRWEMNSEGDMGGADYAPTFALAARTFPPGTKITVQEPRCPKCDELREPAHMPGSRKPLYEGPCRCGFDWDAWVLDNYS